MNPTLPISSASFGCAAAGSIFVGFVFFALRVGTDYSIGFFRTVVYSVRFLSDLLWIWLIDAIFGMLGAIGLFLFGPTRIDGIESQAEAHPQWAFAVAGGLSFLLLRQLLGNSAASRRLANALQNEIAQIDDGRKREPVAKDRWRTLGRLVEARSLASENLMLKFSAIRLEDLDLAGAANAFIQCSDHIDSCRRNRQPTAVSVSAAPAFVIAADRAARSRSRERLSKAAAEAMKYGRHPGTDDYYDSMAKFVRALLDGREVELLKNAAAGI